MEKTETMVCQGCGAKDATRTRQNTAYVDDDRNFAILCPPCQDEANKYWRDQWDEFYSMVMP